MTKTPFFPLVASALAILLSQSGCAVSPGCSPLTASIGQGQVNVLEGSTTLSVIQTARPVVEEYRFTKRQQQLVTKSRGNHGPATVELFDVRTGALQDTIAAHAIEKGQPAWAKGMQD